MPGSSNDTLSRRRFLASTAVAGAGAVIGTVGAGVLGGASVLPAAVAASGTLGEPGTSLAPVIIPFEGVHQAGSTGRASPSRMPSWPRSTWWRRIVMASRGCSRS